MGIFQSKKKPIKNLKKIEDQIVDLNKYITCDGNLSEFIQLSHQITFINCSYNKIKKINNLPRKLMIFFCYSNRLTKIENLPFNIKIFVGCYNNISKIENLPTSLQELRMNGNPVEIIVKEQSIKRKPFTLQTIVLNYILCQL